MNGRFECSIRVSNDAYIHSRSATHWSHAYEQLVPGRFHGTHAEAWLGPLQFGYERVDGAFKYSGRAWPGARIFVSFLPGSGDVFYDGRQIEKGAVLTRRCESVDRVTCNSRAEMLFVTVDESYIERFAARLSGRTLFGKDDGQPVIFSKDKVVVAEFERTILHTLRGISANRQILDDERARQAMQESMLGSLYDALLAQPSESARLHCSSTRARIVDRAIGFIEAKLADPLSTASIAAVVRVPPRTLRTDFKQVIGITPAQYIRSMRLNRVRRELAAGRCCSIESAAVRWGFWHTGRFANYYREAFGEYPSATVRAASKTRGLGPSQPSLASLGEVCSYSEYV